MRRESSLRALARMGVQQRLRKGRHVINEGDVGDTLYIVLSGRLRAYRSAGADVLSAVMTGGLL